MTNAQHLYRVNHSEIRGLARHCRDRAAKLAEVCNDRKFWFGDSWSAPAALPAQAALRVLNGSMRVDPLACNAVNATPNMTIEMRKIVARVVRDALAAYR